MKIAPGQRWRWISTTNDYICEVINCDGPDVEGKIIQICKGDVNLNINVFSLTSNTQQDRLEVHSSSSNNELAGTWIYLHGQDKP